MATIKSNNLRTIKIKYTDLPKESQSKYGIYCKIMSKYIINSPQYPKLFSTCIHKT